MRAFPAIDSTHPFVRLMVVLVTALLLLLTAIMPVFFFAVYRNEGILRVPKRLRLVSLAAALTSGVLLMVDLPVWFRSLGRYWTAMTTVDWRTGATSVLIFVRDPRTIGQLSTCLAVCANIAYVLLLVVLFRQPSEQPETDLPLSRLLMRMAKVATIAWGLVVAFCVLRLFSMPFLFIQFRDAALKIGRNPPLLSNMITEAARTLLSQACLLAVPYVVYKSQRNRIESPVNEQSATEPLESGA